MTMSFVAIEVNDRITRLHLSENTNEETRNSVRIKNYQVVIKWKHSSILQR